jgi:hypothetical protein
MKLRLDTEKLAYFDSTYHPISKQSLEDMLHADEARVNEMITLNKHYGVDVDLGIADYMSDALILYYKWYIKQGVKLDIDEFGCTVDLETGKITLELGPHPDDFDDFSYRNYLLRLLWDLMMSSVYVVKTILYWR